jgi:hypothetical protein
MMINESPADIRLTEEIADLRAVLEGTPSALREQGLFAAYESRLSVLQEELLSLRLASLVSKHQRERTPPRSYRFDAPPNLVADAGRLTLLTEALNSLRRERHRSIISYASAFLVLDWALVAGGIGLFFSDLLVREIRSLQPLIEEHFAVGTLVTFLALGQMFVRQFEKNNTEADHQLELLQNQLEVLSTMYKSKQTPLPQVYERTLKMLDAAGIS